MAKEESKEQAMVSVEISEFCQCECGCKKPSEFSIFDHNQEIFCSLCIQCMYTYCKDVIQTVESVRTDRFPNSSQPLKRAD